MIQYFREGKKNKKWKAEKNKWKTYWEMNKINYKTKNWEKEYKEKLKW